MQDRLISFRKAVNYTADDMAKKIGISTSFYEKIEYGERNPSFNFITAFKKVFPEADTNYIFFDNELHKECK